MANDNPHLRYGFQQLADAEGRLRNCRDSILGTVERLNLPRAEIFSDTFFVPRSVAERWLEKAEQRFLARERESAEHVRSALKRLAAKDDDTGDRDNPDDQGDDSPTGPTDKSKKKSKKKAAPTDEDAEAAEAAAARFFRSREDADNQTRVAAATAAAIIAAGAKRRGEAPKRPDWERQGATATSHLTVVPGAPLPAKGTPARAIIDVGKRRRGEEV